MAMDLWIAVAAFGIGIVVGLTGMGGGALMTPALVLFFGVPPVGSLVHLRRKTVNLGVVKWLALGSVPSAFAGVLILKWMGPSDSVQEWVKMALGLALLLTAALLTVRSIIKLVDRTRGPASAVSHDSAGPLALRPLPTVLLGIIGGVIVGMTSVGSGSIIIIGLMMIYPALKANQLVGTDLVQAVPLVAAAALGHTFFGDLDMGLTIPLLIGSIPGVFLGAQLSSRLSGGFIRRALAFVLLASGLKMLGVDNQTTAVILCAMLFTAPALWMLLRRRRGLPALATTERHQSHKDAPTLVNSSERQ